VATVAVVASATEVAVEVEVVTARAPLFCRLPAYDYLCPFAVNVDVGPL
jgi:hypothetical protein